MTAAATLEVEFKASLDALHKDVRQAEKEISKFAGVSDAAQAKVGRMGQASIAAGGAIRTLVAAAAGFGSVSFAKSAIDNAASLDKMARSAGMTTQAFQTFANGARLQGAGDIAPALAKFSEQAQLARSKLGEMYETLKFISPALADQLTKTKNTAQALELYAEAVRKLSTIEEQAILVKKGFGETSDSLVPILAKGAAGLAEMRSEAAKFTTTVNDDAVKASKNLKTEIDVLANEASNNLINVLSPAIDYVSKAFKSFREGGKQGIYDKLADKSDVAAAAAREIANGFTKIELVSKAASASVEDFNKSLSVKPNYAGADAVAQSVQALAAARGESLRMAQLEGAQQIEAARRVYEAKELSEKEFAEVRKNTEAATSAKIVEIRKDTTNQLKSLEIEALTAKEQDFDALRAQYEMDLQVYSEMVRKKLITEEQFAKARDNLNAAVSTKITAANDKLGEDARKKAEGISQAFENAIGGALTGQFNSAREAAASFTTTLLQGLQKAITTALILEPIMQRIRGSGASSGIAGGLSNMLGMGASAATGDGWGAVVNAFNAEGGDVRAGVPTYVNERAGRKREVFIPHTSGRVVPGERAGATGGGGSSNVYNIDARGADAGVTNRLINSLAAVEAQRSNSIEAQRQFARRYPTRR